MNLVKPKAMKVIAKLLILLPISLDLRLRRYCNIKWRNSRVFSRDEIIPAYGQVALTVYTFLLRRTFIQGWTNPYRNDRDEISVRGEKKKKTRKHFIPRWNFALCKFAFNFWRMYSICFPTLTHFNIMKVTGRVL